MNSPLVRSLVLLALETLLVVSSARAQAPADSPIPADAEIRKILVDRIGAENQGFALVVGVIDANGRRIVAYGSVAKNDPRPLNGDTVFEIGSITKVFTSVVLMDMVQKSEVAVIDPVAKFLPASVKVPERDGKKITLQDLATQNSGLPRMPTNFKSANPENPYADYTPALLHAFLSGYRLTREIGAQFEYSNLGVGLLGHALSLRADMSYEAMVQTRLLRPLGMTSTGLTFTPEMKVRLAKGHGGANFAPVANWDFDALAGAGALRSSANDLLTFLAANLGYVKTPLAAAMAAQLSIRRPASTAMEIAYGWFVTTKNGKSYLWHNGGTGGYRSFIAFEPEARAGVVVLSNFSTQAGPDDIGRHLLNSTFPLSNVGAPKVREEIAADPKTFDRYVGVYLFVPGAAVTVTREGDQLYTRLSGQQKFPMFPEGEGRFFLKVVDAQWSFAVDAEGQATQATLHQNGRDQVAKRADAAQAAQVTGAQAAVDKRIKEQTPAPGSEAALRRHVDEVRAGQPNYDLMSPGLATALRRQLVQIKETIDRLGAVQSTTFKSVAPNGADIFEIQFEHGATEWRILMESEQKIAGLNYRLL
jgi:serine-type D-Ala-D-Ala carboxypeptidase/endopeptidase